MKPTLKTHEENLILCRRCPRLVAWREEVALVKRKAYQDQDYWGKPVPGFGDPDAKIMIVGLAPGAHGSNRTGRMFTGDASGNFLYHALHKAGFANQPSSDYLGDGLELRDVFVTAICRCVPPQNRPNTTEIDNCLPWLADEIDLIPHVQGFVALGKIAFDGICSLYQIKEKALPKMTFAHQAYYRLAKGLPWLLASYHPSQQNTRTGRLTQPMFDEIWKRARTLIE